MTDQACAFDGDREQTLIAYMYDDIAPTDRAAFAAHLTTCVRCRGELHALRAVRQGLTQWAPPEPLFAGRSSAATPPVALHERRARSWREVPVWAQAAAAMLVLGISAGIANLNVHYGADGLTMRTGWSKAQPAAVVETSGRRDVTLTSAPWRDDLAALERRLRSEWQSSDAAARPVLARSTASDDEVVRRVQAMIKESERRQQSELALRVGGVMHDVNVARAADLARIEQTLGAIQNTTGAELMKQRYQMANYLSQVSLKR